MPASPITIVACVILVPVACFCAAYLIAGAQAQRELTKTADALARHAGVVRGRHEGDRDLIRRAHEALRFRRPRPR